jgi:hypothetical protein
MGWTSHGCMQVVAGHVLEPDDRTCDKQPLIPVFSLLWLVFYWVGLAISQAKLSYCTCSYKAVRTHVHVLILFVGLSPRPSLSPTKPNTHAFLYFQQIRGAWYDSLPAHSGYQMQYGRRCGRWESIRYISLGSCRSTQQPGVVAPRITNQYDK